MLKLVRSSGPKNMGNWPNERVKDVQLLFYLYADVLNGGLLQWFGNPPGAFLEETIISLKKISCEKIAIKLEEVVNEEFGILENLDFHERDKIAEKVAADWAVRNRIDERFNFWFEDQLPKFLENFLEHLGDKK